MARPGNRKYSVFALALAGLSFVFSSRGHDEITPVIEQSTARGIKWLIQAQNRDGSWGMDARTPADVACTAVSGLALLSSGNTERDGSDKASVTALQGAVRFVLERARRMRPGGDIAEGERTQIHTYIGQRVHTFLAAVFLTQVYGNRSADFSEETYQEMRLAIQKLTDSIALSQEADGSWHKDTYSSLQATAMAWMALRSANSGGIAIKGAAIDRTLQFIRRQYNGQMRLYDPGANHGSSTLHAVYASASAVRILYGMGLSDHPQTRAAMDTLLNMTAKSSFGQGFLTATGEDYPAAVMVTHALVQEGGERWKTWFDYAGNKFVKMQNADGSWTTTSCLVGRTFATSCALMCLQTPYRLLPIQDL